MSALLNHCDTPRGQGDAAVLPDDGPTKQIFPRCERVGDLNRGGRIVHYVVNVNAGRPVIASAPCGVLW